MGKWANASVDTRGFYKVIFKAGKNVDNQEISLAKKVAVGSGLVLGNLATLGLINVGILSYLRFGGGHSTTKKRKNRSLYIDQQVRQIMGAAVQRTPGHAPKAPSPEDAARYMMFVLGEGRKGSDEAINQPGFQDWWNYFIDPNNFNQLKLQLTQLIQNEGLRDVL